MDRAEITTTMAVVVLIIPTTNSRPNFNSRSGDMTVAATILMGVIISRINMELIMRDNMMSNRNGIRNDLIIFLNVGFNNFLFLKSY